MKVELLIRIHFKLQSRIACKKKKKDTIPQSKNPRTVDFIQNPVQIQHKNQIFFHKKEKQEAMNVPPCSTTTTLLSSPQ